MGIYFKRPNEIMVPSLSPNKKSDKLIDKQANVVDGKTGQVLSYGYPNMKSGTVVIPYPNDYSMLFDGVDEYINIDSVLNALSSNTKGSWSFWVRKSRTGSSENLIRFSDTNGNEFFGVYFATDNTLRFSVRVAGTDKWAFKTDSTSLFPVGTWVHVVVVQDGVSPKLYIDGVDTAITFDISTDKSAWFNNFGGLDNGRIACINFNNLGNVFFFEGYIDEVSLWDKDLTSAEVSSIYNSGSPNDLSQHSASSNLVSWWRMGDKGEFSTNWYLPESSSKLYNRRSMLFDGVDERINIGDIPAYDFESTDAFSLSVWIKRTNFTNQHTILSKMTQSGEFVGWGFTIWGSDELALLLRNSNTLNKRLGVQTTTLINDSNWHHVVATYDGSGNASGVKIYIDGVSDTLTTFWDTLGTNSIKNNANVTIGAFTGTSQYWEGNLDEVSIWDKELTSTEVTELYNLGKPDDLSQHSATSNLVGWWRMGDNATFNTNWTIPDQSTNSNDGTSVNMEQVDNVYDVLMLGSSVNMEQVDRSTLVP